MTRTLTAHTPPAPSLHAGVADPHGTLSNRARQGSAFRLGFLYPVRPDLETSEIQLGLLVSFQACGFEGWTGP